MPLEVIGAGFGRTGTLSLKLALEKLGYRKCHHMKEVMPSRAQIDFWDRASLGESVDWEQVFEGYRASVDWPSAAYYRQLAEFYPDAKVVLSIRDPEKWYQSVSETIYPLSHLLPAWLSMFGLPFAKLRRMILRTVWQNVFDGRFEDKAHTLEVFNRHIGDVKAAIPPERLLIHQATDGWEPLCAFLDKPVPDEPYPRVNESAEIKRAVVLVRWIGRLPWILGIAILLAVAFLILR